MPRIFGLLGYPLGHSFSQRYFTDKFLAEGITDAAYRLFEVEQLTHQGWAELLRETAPGLTGLNVTIPWKVKVLDFLTELDPAAAAIGAVNCIHFTEKGAKGYNTDAIGFKSTLEPWLAGEHNIQKAAVLGTGGASKAVCYVLEQLGIPFVSVSRARKSQTWVYEDLTPASIRDFQLLVNTTPLGMYPEMENYPPLPYTALGREHYLYDLVYNPTETRFLALGKAQGCKTMNGLPMLYAQADAAWTIWNAATDATK